RMTYEESRNMKSTIGRSLSTRSPSAPRRAFTLVELLIVIIIIAVVIAIVFPALRGARDASKKAGTQAMFGELGSASGQFILDTRRTPGYFSPTERGDTANGDRGFTAMENVMLDLAGGIVTPAPGGGIGSGPPPSQLQRIGPLTDPTRQLTVDTALTV